MTPLQFSGQYTDAETGLIYLRARYYDPSTAQFLTVDPDVRATQSAYGYVDNNPLNHADPSGKWLGALIGGVAAALVAPEALVAFAIAVVVVVVVIVVVWAVVSAVDSWKESTAGTYDYDMPNAYDNSQSVAQGKSKSSGMARATDIPSYARGKGKIGSETDEQAAIRIFTENFGRCPTPKDKGAGGDVSKIKKGLSRKNK